MPKFESGGSKGKENAPSDNELLAAYLEANPDVFDNNEVTT